jgi:beta-lactamase class A
MRLTRRAALGLLAVAACPRAAQAATAAIAAIEKRHGGRLGVAVWNTGTGARLAHRADERFPMCSTFKLLLAAAILHRIDRGADPADRFIPYTQDDLLEHAPITNANLRAGGMSLVNLCAAAVEVSDNGAANLLLRHIGGPAAYTAYVRALGDPVTRLDRTEPTLNMFRPGEMRDTTSPHATVQNLSTVLLGNALSPASRTRLVAWMVACQTGATRLRSGLPTSWRIGDKTGTCTYPDYNNCDNDIAILWPPGRAPILVASYYTGEDLSLDAADAAHADVARLIVGTV